jgi:hypothetical protein
MLSFSFDAERALYNLHVELIDLQCDEGLKEKLNSVRRVPIFSECHVIQNADISKTLERCYQCLRRHTNVK